MQAAQLNRGALGRPQPMNASTIILSATLLGAACSSSTGSQVTVGNLHFPLPPGASVVHRAGAHPEFGGTLIDLDERMTIEVAVIPKTPQSLRQYVDSVVAFRNAHLEPGWRLARATDTLVSGRQVLVLHPVCGDCQATELYSEVVGQRFVVAWGVDGLGSRSIEQRDRAGWDAVAGIH